MMYTILILIQIHVLLLTTLITISVGAVVSIVDVGLDTNVLFLIVVMF